MTKTLMFLITYRCNLRCSYCYEPKVVGHGINESQLKENISKQILTLPQEFDSFEIHFMGGEPLLEFDLIRNVSEWLWQQSFDKRLTMIFAPTNGTILTEEIRHWCKANRERFCLGLSFDGDISMQNVNRSNSYEKVDVKFFASTWPRQSVKMTLSPETINKFSDGVKFLHGQGFCEIVADLAMGNSIKWERRHLAQLTHQLDALSTYIITDAHNLRLSTLDLDIFALNDLSRSPQKSCSCGESLSCIDLDGKEYACHLFSPIASPYEKAAASSSIDFKNHEVLGNPQCRACILDALCPHCYGMNYICNESPSIPVPFNCASFKTVYLANCRHRYKLALNSGDEDALAQIGKLINLIA